eukprot:m.121280 g.121280  ORF g.121280 m.121280 type:complete len:595 (+) comp9293_c0_seq2:2302-4086(+)
MSIQLSPTPVFMEGSSVPSPAAEPRAKREPTLLNEEQERKLVGLLRTAYKIVGADLPALSVRAASFTCAIRDRIINKGVSVADVRLNGSAASFVVADSGTEIYNDLDFLFLIDGHGVDNVHDMLEVIREAFFECLREQVPEESRLALSGENFLLQGYVHKMFKMPSKFSSSSSPTEDVWSLITLNCNERRNLEYKFVVRLAREYEFSVDSLQISLQSDLLHRCVHPPSPDVPEAPLLGNIVLMSVFGGGTVEDVLNHLRNRWICTVNPETIRGGGLLKYCLLVAQGYRPIYRDPAEVMRLERVMTTRFTIDYSTESEMHYKLASYFVVRLKTERDVSRIALLVLRDIIKRIDFPVLLKIIDNIIINLPPMPPLDLNNMTQRRVRAQPPPPAVLLQASPIDPNPEPLASLAGPPLDALPPTPIWGPHGGFLEAAMMSPGPIPPGALAGPLLGPPPGPLLGPPPGPPMSLPVGAAVPPPVGPGLPTVVGPDGFMQPIIAPLATMVSPMGGLIPMLVPPMVYAPMPASPLAGRPVGSVSLPTSPARGSGSRPTSARRPTESSSARGAGPGAERARSTSRRGRGSKLDLGALGSVLPP